MNNYERRALMAGLRTLHAQYSDDPDGAYASEAIWRVLNILWRDGDPILPEPLHPSRRDEA